MKLYKKSFKGIALAAFSVLALSACSDWTDSESIKLKEPGIDEQSPELYAKYSLPSLRTRPFSFAAAIEPLAIRSS